MRKALNENPMVQLAVLGVGLILLVVMLFSTVLKGEETPPETATPADPAAATATPSATPSATESATPAPTGEVVPPPTAPGTPEPAQAEALEPSKGLPEDVVRAYAADRPIALLVIDPKAVADERVEEWTAILGARRDVATFIVKAKDIADYARITQGVGVSTTPALVMVRPRQLTDNVPTAIVSTGFEGPRSLEQALDDALYDGRERPPAEAYP